MSRIDACFKRLKSEGKKALIPFVTAGDPKPEVTLPLMHAMVDAGADIIELGIPFSDPMADGPVIQKACERALAHDTSLTDILTITAEFRKSNNTTPVVLMGYLNTLEAFGYTEFAAAASKSGVDGVIIVDMPPEESEVLAPALKEQSVDVIYLLAPTTSEARTKIICQAATGYVYYVSLKGVTGSATLDVDAVSSRLDMIRNITDLPIGVGFGIKDAASAQAVAKVADGVVVGSVLVARLEEFAGDTIKINTAVSSILKEMRQAMDES